MTDVLLIFILIILIVILSANIYFFNNFHKKLSNILSTLNEITKID